MDDREIRERLMLAEQSIGSAHERLDELAESTKALTEIVIEMKYMRRDLNRLIERVSNVEGAPARRYDYIINALITAVIAAAISFIMN